LVASIDEYLAELYTLAVLRPGFLHQKLPAGQIAWLKRVVFHTPSAEELGRQVAITEPVLTEFLLRANRLFTREQMDALITELNTRSHRPEEQVV
jgi:hypothetical protein